MSKSRRNFLIVNLGLVALIGLMIWFLFSQGQGNFVNVPADAEKQAVAPVSGNAAQPAYSTEGMSDKDIQAIEALQAQLEAEKARAEESRAQIQARQAEKAGLTTPPQPGGTETGGLDVEEQKQRIARLIEAQLKGAAEQNRRLAEELARKNREIEQVRRQNTQLTRRLSELDNSAQTLLENLMEGDDISRSDLDYIGAMQALANDPGNAPASTEVDLINRVQVADSGDTGSVAADLRSMVNKLMEQPEAPINATSINNQLSTMPTNRNSDLQASVNALMARNQQGTGQQQQNANTRYLQSLRTVEEERQNETRWVTVREGDTLYDIAVRVYDDGYLYPKIFEANPQVLTNPDRIKPGQRLRVPL